MTNLWECLKIYPVNKRNEKVQNISLSGIGYRTQLYHYYDKIHVNYTSVFFTIIISLFSQLEKRGVFAYAEIPAFL